MHDDEEESEFEEVDTKMQREFNNKMMEMQELNGKACHALRYVECFSGEKLVEKEQRVYDAALDVLLAYFK